MSSGKHMVMRSCLFILLPALASCQVWKARDGTRSSDKTRFDSLDPDDGGESLPLVDQSTIDYMAENISVRYRVLDNLQDGNSSFLAQVSLLNIGQRDVVAGNWGLYFNVPTAQMVPVEQQVVKAEHVTIKHVKGCLFKMEPTPQFKPLKPDQTRKVKFRVQKWSVAKTDMMPNWYVWAEGLEGRIIVSTKGPDLAFVDDFTTPEQWKRYNTTGNRDRYNPYTPEQRYAISEDIPDLGSAQHPVLPTPVSIILDRNSDPLLVSSLKLIVTVPTFEAEAQYLRDELYKGGYTSLSVSLSAHPKTGYIQLVDREPHVVINNQTSTSPEAYSLTVDPVTSVIDISSTTPHGIFNGIQSLLSLVLKHYPDGKIPKLTIEDAPRFEHRGMHLDVCRNFHSKEDVMKLLDAMAMYKLNKFHFHLTEDEGWRVEIPGLDELTKIGGQRCHDLTEEKCVISQFGSGPDTTTSGSGFYTVEDYKEILRYAKTRHIEVIPEVESPGHAHAAVISMLARRKRLLDSGDVANANRYLLTDLNDTSDYLSIQLFKDNAINPCISSTYAFFEYVIDQFIEMHKNINPLTTFHLGGDEVAEGAWLDSPACQSLLRANVSLKEYFSQSLANITARRGLSLRVWENGVMESSSKLFERDAFKNDDIVANAWNNVWEKGGVSRAYALANANYKVVLSHATHLFLDQAYEPDPEERGLYWATRFTDTYKTFGYLPYSVYDNVDVKLSGERITKEELCGDDGSKCTPLEKPQNILGMQGQLWSETIRTTDNIFYMLFPRLIALAERAWHKAPWEDTLHMTLKRDEWKLFANTIGYQEFPALDKMNTSYRVPLPGVKPDNGLLRVVSPYPGLKFVISTDNGKSWRTGQKDMSIEAGQTVLVSHTSADGKRRGRAVTLKMPDAPGATPTTASSATTPNIPICFLWICITFVLFQL